MAVPLSDKALELLNGKNLAWVGTVNKDGSPQVTPVWVDTDGKNVIFNTAEGRVKTNNLKRDARVSVAVGDADNLYNYASIKGRVVEMTTEGGNEHINKLSHKYNGSDYPFRDGEVRVIVTIEPEKTGGM